MYLDWEDCREPETDDHCVYRYTCKEGQCNLSYIGYTQCKLIDKMSIKNHILEHHPTQKFTTNELLNNVSILYRCNMKSDLTIAEALFVYKFKPQINAQSEFCHGMLNLF